MARGQTTDWLVNTADDPPLLRTVVNDTPIAIKRHMDETRPASRTSALAADMRGCGTGGGEHRPEAKTNPFFPPEEDDDMLFEDRVNDEVGTEDQAGSGQLDQDGMVTMGGMGAATDVSGHTARVHPKPTPKATPQPRAPLRTSPTSAADARAADRSRSPPMIMHKTNAESIITQLRQDIASRDAMIASLNQNIMALTAQMSEMQAQFQRQMQEQQQQQQSQQQMFQQQMAQMQTAFQTHAAAQQPTGEF